MIESSKPAIRIDLNDFKLHLHLKNRIQLTLHFNSPSRRFYLSVIALVVNEMKKVGKIKSISLQEHVELLALLNESVGGAAGSSDRENLLPRIYRKWKNALPNLEEAPLFRVLGKKKEEGEGAAGKVYLFSDAEKDGWANLFDYMGSEENVRLKFAIDKMGLSLNETSIIFGDYTDDEAWNRFISGLKKGEEEQQGGNEEKFDSEKEERDLEEPEPVPQPATMSVRSRRGGNFAWPAQHRWVLLIAAVGMLAGGLALWNAYWRKPVNIASVSRMKYPLPEKPSIAVLPFVNMSEDPKQEFFSDGLTEEITTSLSKSPNLFVVSRHSAFTYKGRPVRVDQVAEELGVRYVVEGSVRRAGEKIRINAQLIDATTGRHLWADKYDGVMKDVFALQDQMTDKIVSALAGKLTGGEKQWARKDTENVAAYDAFLRGYTYYLRATPDDSAKAVASLQQAIELDPNYQRPYAALAAVYYTASWMLPWLKPLGVSWHESRARAIEYLQKSPEGPLARAVKSQRYIFTRRHEKAISELEKALALDPNDPVSHLYMGSALSWAGRPRQGIEFFKSGLRLDPHNPSRYVAGLGGAHFALGEVKEAVDLVEKAIRLNPENSPGMHWLPAYYALLGREQEARAVVETLKDARFDTPGTVNLRWFMNSMPYQDRAVAERVVQGYLKAGVLRADIPGGYFPAFKENQLTGEEISNLLFGSSISGYVFYPQRFSMTYKKNGYIIWEGPSTLGGPTSDTGKSRIEGDAICWQYQKRFKGVEFCGTVFRYPGGTYEKKNEYFWATDFGFGTFSPLR